MRVDYLKAEILTPVHIGTGEQVDALGYLMREEGRDIHCYFVDLAAWTAEHPEPDKLGTLFSGNNIPAIRAFIDEHLDPHSYARRRAAVSESGMFEEYRRKLRDQSTSNQLLIDPQLATGLGRPLLPGSSVKGAIRTAVIDHLDRTRKLGLKRATLSRDKWAYDKQLQAVLGKITDSAFKQLKLSDFEGWSDSTVLVTAAEVRRNPEKNVTPKSHAEVLPSQVLGEADYAVLYGKLIMGYGQAEDPANARLTLPNDESWNWFELAALVNRYQAKRLAREKERFYGLGQFADARQAVALVAQALAQAAPGQMVLRLGHYSQVEYVTVEDNAPLTRKGRDGKPLPSGTTRTLANGRLPFGWVRLTPCGEADYRRHDQARQEHGHVIDQARLARRMDIRAEKERLEAHRREEERRNEEERLHPWRALLRQLAEVDNWGDFRQQALAGDLADYRDKEDVAEQVRDKAFELRRGKWDAERDALVAQWLEPTGLAWQVEDAPAEEAADLTVEQQARLDRIQGFADWGQYKAVGLALADMPRPLLDALRDKLKEWGCDNKKAKKDKQKAWKILQRLLKKA